MESYERDDPTATNAITSVAVSLLFVGTVAGTLAAPWLIDAYVAVVGNTQHVGHAAQQALATDLLRWFMPQMLFYGITALATSLLNARRRFAAAAFAPVLNNVVVIVMLIAVGRATAAPPTVRSVLDDPWLVLLLGLGTTIGVVAMALVLLPAVHRAGIRVRWHWAPGHPAVRRLARLSGWTVGYVAANQVAFFVVLALAYRSQSNISVYLAAFTFFQLPHGLLAVSVMTALGPELASRHQAGDTPGLRDHFARGLHMLLIVMIPAAVALAVLARPLISALLDHGDFTAHDVVRTADALRAFAVGLVPFSVYLYVVRAFSSMQDTRTPFLLNVVENGTNIATAFAFYEWRGVEGLAWSWSFAYCVAAVLGLLTLRHRLARIDGRRLASVTLRVLGATAPAAFVAFALDRVLDPATPSASLVTLGLAAVLGGALFVGLLQLAGIHLIRMIRDMLRRDAAPVVRNA